MSIKLSNILNETKINKPDTATYKYKVGETVRELYGDEESCKILDRRPNWEAVISNPTNREYIFQHPYEDDNTINEPWYLIQWLEHNKDARPTWWTEEELQPYNNINENIITNTNNEKKTISIDGYDNVSYKVMPNTKFVELRIDNSPQYRLQHDDALGYYPDNSLMSNTFKESVLNRIVKHLRERDIRAIVIDDTILMTNVNSINENINEIKINAPDTTEYKIADWVYKYFTEDPYDYDDEKAEVELGPDEAMAMGILWRNMNIFDKNTVNVSDIERWRNEPGNNLKDSTVDEILHYLTSLVLIKKNQSLNEIKINQPTPGLPADFTNDVKDAINRHIVSLVKDHEEYYNTPAVEFVKDEKYDTHDAVIDFIKEHMVVNHYEFEKDGKEIIASPLNVSTISDEDVLDYLNDNIDLKRYINKVIWKAYFETIDINEIRSKVFNYIINKEHPDLPYTRNTKDYYDVYIPLLIEKVVDYYIEPSEIFNKNDFVQSVNNTLLKSNFINEIKINKPAITYKIADWVKYEYGMNDYYYVRHEYGEDVADACTILNDIVHLDQVETINTNEIDTWLKSKVGKDFWAGDVDSLVDFLLKTDVIRDLNKTNEIKINKPNNNKYISLEKDEDGNRYYVIDKGLIHSYLESVIDPEYIDDVETFMSDEEGWEESTLNGLSDFDFENATDEDIEDFATSEMSFFLTSHPDEFPFKDGLNEIKINKPNNIKNYRISWYDGPDQFAQEKVETTLEDAEKLAMTKLKGAYLYRKSYEYWAVIEENLADDDIIPRYSEVERINLDPEINGLYADIRVYDNDQREFVTTKTVKL
jgi:hypothetical protein